MPALSSRRPDAGKDNIDDAFGVRTGQRAVWTSLGRPPDEEIWRATKAVRLRESSDDPAEWF